MAGYDWHDEKNEENIKKHKVSFEEAIAIFSDPLLRIANERSEDYSEDRFIALGQSPSGLNLVVVFCEREIEGEEVIWIISARKQTPKEKRLLAELRLR
jgi:uncharacterized DUF497 family protein